MKWTALLIGFVIAWNSPATEDCVRQAATELEINLSAGVYTERVQVSAPLKLRIPTGINPHAYGACLQIKGHDPARSLVNTVASMRECQQAARTTRLVATSPANSLHIASEVDAAFYESCVKNQIDVEVFVPTAALD